MLKSGKIEEKGSFQHLMKNGMDFSAFLAEESKEETEEDSDVKKKNLRNRTMSLTSDTHSEMSTTNPHNSVTIQTVIEEEEAEDGRHGDPLKEPESIKERQHSPVFSVQCNANPTNEQNSKLSTFP